MINGLEVNERGHLQLGGCDTVELARRFGTPLYVLDESLIRQNCARYREALAQCYPDSRVAYAGKAFMTSAICRLVEEEGLSLDTVSGGEIYTALQTGFPAERIIFHGNNKSEAEIDLALRAGVGRLVVDSFSELALLSRIAAARSLEANIYLRVNPAVAPTTHAYIQTGQADSKFGFGLDTQVQKAVARAVKLPGLNLRGLHCHIGSQILSLAPFRRAAEVMVGLMAKIRREQGLTLAELDLGGGLGIRYRREDSPPAIEDYVRALTGTVKAEAARYGLPLPRLLIEPGRSIVGPAGTTLFQVGCCKVVPGVRKYVAVDGGMMSDPRPALYGARYTFVVANRALEPARKLVTIAGKACESGDILIRDVELPALRRGDILAMLATGAYHHSLASNYNHIARPAAVFVNAGRAELVVARENYADLVRRDFIPPHMLRKAAQGEPAAPTPTDH
jgi:diaminopimelate decarboxylase